PSRAPVPAPDSQYCPMRESLSRQLQKHCVLPVPPQHRAASVHRVSWLSWQSCTHFRLSGYIVDKISPQRHKEHKEILKTGENDSTITQDCKRKPSSVSLAVIAFPLNRTPFQPRKQFI